MIYNIYKIKIAYVIKNKHVYVFSLVIFTQFVIGCIITQSVPTFLRAFGGGSRHLFVFTFFTIGILGAMFRQTQVPVTFLHDITFLVTPSLECAIVDLIIFTFKILPYALGRIPHLVPHHEREDHRAFPLWNQPKIGFGQQGVRERLWFGFHEVTDRVPNHIIESIMIFKLFVVCRRVKKARRQTCL